MTDEKINFLKNKLPDGMYLKMLEWEPASCQNQSKVENKKNKYNFLFILYHKLYIFLKISLQ